MAEDVDTGSANSASSGKKAPGLTIAAKLILAFTGLIVVIGVLLIVTYQFYVPAMVLKQVELRAESVTRAFAAAALPPVVEKNYLRINKIAEATAQLPDVAYAAAVNDKGFPVAGIFGDVNRFDVAFAASAKEKGFPKEVLDQNRLAEGVAFNKKAFTVGGQRILEYAMRLENTGAEVRVGLFTAGVEGAVRASLWPLLILLVVMAAVGVGVLLLVARTVSGPIHELSAQAERISMGHLDQEIHVDAGGEVWQLAEAFKRMQKSIRYTMTHAGK